MKKILFAICLTPIVDELAAQMPSVTLDTTDRKYLLLGIVKRNLLEQGRFSHSTSKGKVYILPYDNMPCLVPDMQQVAPMPALIQKFPESRMPNVIPRRQLIPKDKKPQ